MTVIQSDLVALFRHHQRLRSFQSLILMSFNGHQLFAPYIEDIEFPIVRKSKSVSAGAERCSGHRYGRISNEKPDVLSLNLCRITRCVDKAGNNEPVSTKFHGRSIAHLRRGTLALIVKACRSDPRKLCAFQ